MDKCFSGKLSSGEWPGVNHSIIFNHLQSVTDSNYDSHIPRRGPGLGLSNKCWCNNIQSNGIRHKGSQKMGLEFLNHDFNGLERMYTVV
jgi:hypothetical protein